MHVRSLPARPLVKCLDCTSGKSASCCTVYRQSELASPLDCSLLPALYNGGSYLSWLLRQSWTKSRAKGSRPEPYLTRLALLLLRPFFSFTPSFHPPFLWHHGIISDGSLDQRCTQALRRRPTPCPPPPRPVSYYLHLCRPPLFPLLLLPRLCVLSCPLVSLIHWRTKQVCECDCQCQCLGVGWS